jgi:AcrR family transcriptional regulator
LAGKITSESGVESEGSKKPIGRRERRSAETRKNIFQSAMQLFADRGFSATTIDAIAEAADIGKGTFFNYFENKESILLEYQEMQMGKVKAFVAASLNSDEPLTTLVYKLACTMTQEQQKSPALFQSLMTAIFSNEAVGNRMAAGMKLGRGMLAELIEKRQQSGEIRNDTAALDLAHSLQRMILGTMLVWSLSPESRLEDNLRAVTEVFIHGIRSR